MSGIGKQHGIRIAKDWEFSPVLRDEIAQFLDEHYVEEEAADARRESLTHSFAMMDFDCAMPDAGPMAGAAAAEADAADGFAEDAVPGAEDAVSADKGAVFAGLGALAAGAAAAGAGRHMGQKAAAAKTEASGDLRSWLDRLDAPFSTTLMELIDAKGLSDTDVYKRANMSRQLFSRIRSDADYRPAKKTVLALAIAMKLDLRETQDLLERAGFALSRSSKRDVIVEYFITKGNHNLFDINEALYEFDQPLI